MAAEIVRKKKLGSHSWRSTSVNGLNGFVLAVSATMQKTRSRDWTGRRQGRCVPAGHLRAQSMASPELLLRKEGADSQNW